MKKILFVIHSAQQCGVYQFGNEVFDAIAGSSKYQFIKTPCDSLEELKKQVALHDPAAVIYNFHPSVMPWVFSKTAKGLYHNNIAGIKCLQIGIIHEITQEVADRATSYRNSVVTGTSKDMLNSLFDFYISADPTLLLKNPFVFKTGRLIPVYSGSSHEKDNIPVIGSFGFGTPNKGFEDIVTKVQQEFDEAIIRFNIPFAEFGDKDGTHAKQIADHCRSLIKKPGIRLEVSHDFLPKEDVLKFLAGNDLNVFLYKDKGGRGLSSATDLAMAVKKPVAVSECPMFRHILSVKPTVSAEKLSLKEIMNNGFASLEKLAGRWDSKNLLWDYERILDTVFGDKARFAPAPVTGVKNKLKRAFKKIFNIPDYSHFTWLRDTESANKDDMSVDRNLSYSPVILRSGAGFNRILDDEAREIYRPAIDLLKKAVPLTMAKKIDRANVQQGFVFDTVCRFAGELKDPKLLCAGSYEDTASMSLQKMGFEIEETDPMINYTIQEFYSKPSTVKNSYDIVFSTSVIEHVVDDRSFIECIEGLLVPGGLAVITMDYKDNWVPGQPKPDVDARFYTKKDMEERLLSYIPSCELIDEGKWDCPNPDFVYLNKYRYTFATFVFRKKK